MAGAMVVMPFLAIATEVGPETIDMKAAFKVEGTKQAVIFPHRRHQAKLACGTCHKSPEGGDDLLVEFVNKSGPGNDFHKKFCWPCHAEMNVPKGKSCATCHK
jgi:hypothetical protein